MYMNSINAYSLYHYLSGHINDLALLRYVV